MGSVSIDFLKNVGLFRGLNISQLEKVRPLCETVEYRANEKIFGEGEKAQHLYFVVDGEVDIRFDLPHQATSRAMTITTILPGKSFGWPSMVEPFVYARSAYCATDKCATGRINGADLRRTLAKDTGIGYVIMTNLARVIAKRYHRLQEEVANRGGWA